ncbi:hypothetical protein RCO48_19570 [Peribacillus frigoritolerans]|nr:hypothetical protein [Peribacillus frigoritolerans]
MAYGGIALLIGIILAQTFTYITIVDFSTASILGVLPVTIVLIIINLIQVKRKKDETPELDERTVNNMFKFYIYSSHIFLGLLFISLAIITFMDIRNVSTSHLWIIILAYMCCSGIGALIVKRQ